MLFCAVLLHALNPLREGQDRNEINEMKWSMKLTMLTIFEVMLLVMYMGIL